MDWMTWIGYLALKVNGVTSRNVHHNSHKYGAVGLRKAVVIRIREIHGSNVTFRRLMSTTVDVPHR